MKKRILSIVLAIAMLATLVPMGIFASAESTAQPAAELTISEKIDSVDVLGYVAPTVGADIAENLAGLTVPEGANYSINDACWYNETLDRYERDGSFIAGCTYRLKVYIKIDSGCFFANELVMQFNGDASLVDRDFDYCNSGADYAYLYSVTTQLEGKVPFVDTVNINGYVAPTVGADIAENLAGLTVPEGARYSIYYAHWYNETLERNEWDGAFTAGCAYSLYVEIDIASGYVFANELVMQFNGDASLADPDSSYFSKSYGYFYSVDTQLEGEVLFVDTVNVNGYVAPTAGADIAENLAGITVPEGASYSIDYVGWYNETLKLTERNGTFVANCAYYLYVIIDVASGYFFANDLVMQFNGDASLVDLDISYSGTDYAYLYSVTTQLEGEAPVVDTINVNGYVAPTVGANIAENLAGLSVPEGAPYSINPYWYNVTLGRYERKGTFVSGCAYHLYVIIYVDSGYIFSDELVMQFNGDASLVDRDSSHCYSEEGYAYIYSVATQLEGEVPFVDTVNVNGYVAPTAGADIADSLAGITVPEGAPYSIDYTAYWRNETLGRDEWDGSFIAGCTYRLHVRIDVASGYFFADELVMQFNGDASLVDTDRSSSGTDYAHPYSVATQLEGEVPFVDIVNVNGYVAPTVGADIAESLAGLTVPEGAHYSIYYPYWRNETFDRDENSGTFISGCTYRLLVMIRVASGYIFANELVMQFNGDASLVDTDRSSSGANYADLYSVTTQLEGTVDTVNVIGYVAPTVGADIAESLAGLSVPDGAPYIINPYWYNETLDSFCREGTFIAGYTYRLYIDVFVASGYLFADDLVMQFNGDASLVDRDSSHCYSEEGYAYIYSVATELSAPAEFFTFASGADTTYVSIDETNGHLVFKAGSKTAADVIALFADTNISITKANGNAISETAKVGTTCIITSTINGESKSLTVVVVGDLTGDGNVNALDCAKCALHVKSTTPITNPAVLAAANSLSNSATINALDINRIGLFIKDSIQNF